MLTRASAPAPAAAPAPHAAPAAAPAVASAALGERAPGARIRQPNYRRNWYGECRGAGQARTDRLHTVRGAGEVTPWWTDAARSSTEPPHVARVFSTTPLRTLGMR